MSGIDVAQLQEDKEYLELKLKYVQSVSTIFRQKVAVLLRNVWGSPARDVPRDDDDDDSEGQVTALRDMIAEMEAQDAVSPSQPLANMERSDYWRERFLRAMEETRPTNLQEAQTLCALLQERNEIAERLGDAKRELDVCRCELQKMKDSYLRVLTDRAVGADEAVVERYRHKEAELLALSPKGSSKSLEELDTVREDLQKSEARMKVLRLRNSQLQKELDSARADFVSLHTSHREQVADLTRATQELRAKLAVRDGEARRAEASRNIAEQSVLLKDSTITRLEARIHALEKEVHAVLKEGTGSVDTNEGAILRRQIDTFELKLREQEALISQRTAKIHELEGTVETLRDTIGAKCLQIDAKQRLVDTLQKRLETQRIDADQRDSHNSMIQTFEQRMLAAVADVSSRQNVVDLVATVSELQRRLDQMSSVQETLDKTQTELAKTKASLAAYRAELARCVKLERVPTLDAVEDEIVLNDLRPISEGGDGRHAGATGEVILRTEGAWKEVRDLSSGKLYFVTTDVTITPFKPRPVRKAASRPPSSTPSTPREQTREANVNDVSNPTSPPPPPAEPSRTPVASETPNDEPHSAIAGGETGVTSGGDQTTAPEDNTPTSKAANGADSQGSPPASPGSDDDLTPPFSP